MAVETITSSNFASEVLVLLTTDVQPQSVSSGLMPAGG